MRHQSQTTSTKYQGKILRWGKKKDVCTFRRKCYTSCLIIYAVLFVLLSGALNHIKYTTNIATKQPQIRSSPFSLTIDSFSSKRKCSRLVLFLHLHKAGGTSLLGFIRDSNLTDIQESNAIYNPPLSRLMLNYAWNETVHPTYSYGIYGAFCDQIQVSSGMGKLQRRKNPCTKAKPFYRPPESSNNHISSPLQLSDTNLWSGIHSAGADYVAFEYNFIPPFVFVQNRQEEPKLSLRSAAATVVQLRDPWERYESTYYRELYLECLKRNWNLGLVQRRKTVVLPPAQAQCLKENTMQIWMEQRSSERLKINKVYPGILSPNYMVRMLVGLADRPDMVLTRDHLHQATVSLEQFDLVLHMEMPEEDRNAALNIFFNNKDSKVMLAHNSNNNLKWWPDVYKDIKAESQLSKSAFMELIKLDIELYEIAKVLVERRKHAPLARC